MSQTFASITSRIDTSEGQLEAATRKARPADLSAAESLLISGQMIPGGQENHHAHSDVDVPSEEAYTRLESSWHRTLDCDLGGVSFVSTLHPPHFLHSR